MKTVGVTMEPQCGVPNGYNLSLSAMSLPSSFSSVVFRLHTTALGSFPPLSPCSLPHHFEGSKLIYVYDNRQDSGRCLKMSGSGHLLSAEYRKSCKQPKVTEITEPCASSPMISGPARCLVIHFQSTMNKQCHSPA